MNDVRTPLLPLRRPVVASLALASALVVTFVSVSACGSLTPGTTDNADGTGETGGNDETMDTPTGGGVEEVTIYDIQQGKVADKTLVQLKNVVVTSAPYMSKKMEANFFVAEMDGGEFSGIQVYVYADTTAELDAEGKLPQVGDILELRVQYQEFFEYSELVLQAVGDMTITGSGAAPTPTTVKAADVATGGPKAENFEGCLVQIENAEVTAPVVEFGQFTIDGSLLVDDQFFVPDNPSPNPPMGTKFTKLAGVMTYNFEEFKLLPRDCADFVGWDGCAMEQPTTDTNPDCMADAGEYTIFQLQQDAVCKGTEMVTVTGAVVTSGLTFNKNGFYIQDPMGGEYSGIFVFIGPDNPNMIVTNPGDIVTVTGAYDDFYGAAQLEVTTPDGVMVTGTTDVPTPEVMAPADIATGGPKAEAYEGVLVQVNDVAAVADLMDHNEWSVDDDLRIDDLFFAMADWTIPPPGTAYMSIAGPLAFTFDNTKIVPRNADDIKPAP